jgi:type IV secretory pathway VirB9-like protein
LCSIGEKLISGFVRVLSDSSYKNWWEPPDEIIVIKPKQEKPSTTASVPVERTVKPEQVFLM